MNDPQPEGHMARYIGRRKFLATLLGGAAAAWPLAAGAQETAMPVVAFVTPSERDSFPPRYVAAFRKGLSDTGYIEGQNVSVEYHWLEGRYDRLPALMADLVRRQVSVIATPGGSFTALAAKAVTATIPIVFGVAENPVSTGLVANLARPGGNATGINFFLGEVVAKRLGLLHELVPKAVRLGVLVNYQPPVRNSPRSRRFSSATRSRSTFRGKRTRKRHLVDAGWDDAKVVQPDGCGQARR